MNPDINNFNYSTVFPNWRMQGQYFPHVPISATAAVGAVALSFITYRPPWRS